MNTNPDDLDLDRRLADLRLAPAWSVSEQQAALDAILAASPTDPVQPRRPRVVRRALVLTAAAGVAAAGLVGAGTLLPSGAPGGPSSADAVQALHAIADLAARQPVSAADQAGPGQFVHELLVDHQNALADQGASDSRYESWIAYDGRIWQRRDVNAEIGPDEHQTLEIPPGQYSPDYPSREYIDSLPTDPDALESVLRSHTTGSTSSDERVFVALQAMLARNIAKPEFRSAAIQVLTRLGHVQLGKATEDSQGNPAEEFDFVDPDGRPGDVTALLFDTRTAELTEQQEYFHGKLLYESTVQVLEVVDSVPADIRAEAITPS